ncbi:MAG: V-type ATP synthase subunit I, partial [Nitrospirota bacterium]|nr:V-type ATP synthase subunit I [Nitrospirota bacterium]
FLVKRIRDLQPWGDFAFPPEDELAGQKFWFYTVPHKDMDQLRQSELVWQIVHRDNRHCHVAVIAEDEPASSSMPVARTHTGARPRSDLQRELERVEIEIEEIVAKREELTKWIHLISANLTQAEDQAARELAAAEALDDTDLFAVQGWLRADDVGLAQNFAAEHELAMMVEDPGPEDKPPTLMANRPGLSSGEDLVEFYQTPGYREWDPSTIVFFSFALFFAMIMADAGYGLILTAVVAYYWKRMGESATGLRMRKLAAALAGATIGYGILTGGYFGVSPPEGSLLGFFHILDLNDINAQMKLSITIGVAHIVLANAIKSHHAVGLSGRLQPLAWSCGAIGGLLMYLGAGSSFWFGLGVVLLAVGLIAVAVFASDR